MEQQISFKQSAFDLKDLDEKKGVVIGWEKKELVNPKCKTL